MNWPMARFTVGLQKGRGCPGKAVCPEGSESRDTWASSGFFFFVVSEDADDIFLLQ